MIDFPNSPTVGQVVTAPSGTAWRWTGSTWLLGTAASAGGARGTVAYAEIRAIQTGITTTVDVAGLAVIVPTVAGRRYKVTVELQASSTVVGDSGIMDLVDGAGAILQRAVAVTAIANYAVKHSAEVVYAAATTTAVTFKVRYGRLSGTGTHQVYADPGYPVFILVEDITFEQPSTGGGGGGGSGYTFVSDTKPTAANVGDTWFNSSTGASGGVSYVAIEEAPGGEKVWVQTSPGSGGSSAPINPGLPALQKATVGPSGIVSPTAVPGAQVNFTGVAGAVYRITVQATVFVGGAATQAALLIYRNSVQIQGAYSLSIPAGGYQTLMATMTDEPGALALTYQMVLNRQGGTGTVGLTLDAVRPDFILVERMTIG